MGISDASRSGLPPLWIARCRRLCPPFLAIFSFLCSISQSPPLSYASSRISQYQRPPTTFTRILLAIFRHRPDKNITESKYFQYVWHPSVNTVVQQMMLLILYNAYTPLAFSHEQPSSQIQE
ncbi:hypothetical protein AB6A40_007853 [Gnathostoma spinigerum]|uniref:Uncharacterized protein n=1 Tax=Gnathostoma spinigerum TaxID=75299 RepID=A0ABD6ESL0_9BILA